MDIWVQNAQKWVNETYKNVVGFIPAPTDGRTGWKTMFALTRALQTELGIAELSDNFGPTTLAELAEQFGNVSSTTKNANVRAIVQCALWCKGYSGGDTFGTWDSSTTMAIATLRTDLGLSATASIAPKVFKSLLTMNAYVLIENGSPVIRSIQRSLNARYLSRADFAILPCDGHFSRDVQSGLLYAIQYEIGMADGTANGNFGPGTQAGLRTPAAAVSEGSADGSKYFVHLFQAAMTCNRYDTPFTGTFTADTRARVAQFQAFAALPVTGVADFATWASLLVSTGDIDRPGRAVDCVTTITTTRAQTLAANGYEIVGRYLTNFPGPDPLDKKLKPGELATIFNNGLRVFPIFQQGGDELEYFTYEKGVQNGSTAVDAALYYGFKRGTVIYYAVDYDAIEDEVYSDVIPYFEGIRDGVASRGSLYQIGIYGSRNTCSIVSNANLATLSFVSGMSTGYSGNLGYPLPTNWAFDQILEYDIGTGDGYIAIDKDIVSDRDYGQDSVELINPPARLDVPLPEAMRPALAAEAVAWLNAAMNPAQHASAIRSRNAAVELAFRHDALFTTLAVGYRMRKALVQTATIWECAVENVADTAVDLQVKATYGYYQQVEAWQQLPQDQQEGTPIPIPPEMLRDDSSTGVSQIFAASAISAVNWGRGLGLTNEPALDFANWKHRWYMWNRLNADEAFNITMATLVLLWGATLAGVDTRDFLAYTDADVRAILAKYNGDDDYGTRNFNLYVILEQANATARTV